MQLKQHRISSGTGSGSRVAHRVSRGPTPCSAVANPVAGTKFDYIVVGGGTAGCVLANRLTADGTKSALVLEAGPSGDSLEIGVPAGIARLFRHPVLDWGLNSSTQKPLTSREVYLARGKALGGSSCTNATLYHRGSPADYDSWGLEGWKAKDLVDWFISAENYGNAPAPFHGVGGIMQTEQPRYQNPLHEAFFRACQAAGLPENTDFNDWSRPQAGYGEFQVTQRNGHRADMYRTYLKPAMTRGNLKVLTGMRTTKLQFEHSSSPGSLPRTVGVEFSPANDSFGDRFSAQLAPEGQVLLCAGAVHSPHLLQLSGVGPRQALAEHGIPLVADLQGVGANLQDHPATLFAARTDDKFDNLAVTSQAYDRSSNVRITALLQYLLQRRGPLATTGCDHGAFLSTTGKGEPDLQIRFVPGFALDPDAIQSYIKFGENKKHGIAWPCGITMQLLAVRPHSVGSVGLKSSDPFAAPAVDIGYYSGAGEKDLITLREGLKIARRIAEASPLSEYGTSERYPGPRATSDADLDEFIRKTTCSGNALVGTCRMGPASDSSTVVSHTDMSVHGVAGLRVVDASVMPRIPGGQTGAPTVMIAERVAAMLVGQQARVGSTPGRGGSQQMAGRTLVGAA
ncbi:GMC oxidoreductase-domain-containing protein [Haematococcus lacustris]